MDATSGPPVDISLHREGKIVSQLHRKRRAAFGATAALLLTAALAACGESTADQDPASDSGPSGELSAEAEAAKAVIDEYTEAPTSITQTEPLPEAPPTGEKVVWLSCDLPVCGLIGKGVEDAAAAAGWEYEQINYEGANPATLTAAFERALTVDPTAVIESGVPPEAGWSSVIPDYIDAGVPIITSYISTPTEDLPEGIIANVGGPPVFDEYAKVIANWFIWNSNAEGKALIHRVDAYPILKLHADQLVGYIEAGCSECDISTEVQSTAADVGSGQLVQSVVSALKRDPDLEYMLTADIEFFDGLPAAMTAAGLEDVKVAGQNPTLAGMGQIHSGEFAMAASHPNEEAGWVLMDVAFRHAMGLEIPAEDIGPLPTHMLLPGGDFPTDEIIDWPLDFRDQFEELWNLS